MRQVAASLAAKMEILAHGLYHRDRLPKLPLPDFARGHLDLRRMQVHVPWPCFENVSDMRLAATHGPLHFLWNHVNFARAMRLQTRCKKLFVMLKAARWLTTSQVHRRFFPNASLDASRKRLRKLVEAGYLKKYREHHMSEALFALGPEGEGVLDLGGKEFILERKPPKQLLHFIGVNDLRIAAELAGPVSYFFSYWELPEVGWRYPAIPDAIFSLRDRAFALEFDRGVEGAKFFVKTKVRFYRRGIEGFPLAAVLIVADRKGRLVSLARSIPNERGLFLFSTLDDIRKRGLLARVFYRRLDEAPISLFQTSLVNLSFREESFFALRGGNSRC